MKKIELTLLILTEPMNLRPFIFFFEIEKIYIKSEIKLWVKCLLMNVVFSHYPYVSIWKYYLV